MMRASLLAAVMGACASLAPAAAYGADVKGECIAAADQGQSLRDDGKYHRARDAFTTCARDVCPKVVERSCTQWLRQIEDATPTVVLGAKDEGGADLASAHVTIDGASLSDLLDGKPVPVDPGEHVIRFEHAGSSPAETHVVLRAGEKNREVSVTMRALATAAPVDTMVTPPPAADETAHASLFTPRNVTAVSLIVLGAAAAGTGAYFLAQSGSDSDTANGIRSAIPQNACTHDTSSAPCQSLGDAVDAHYRDETIGAVMAIGAGALVVAAAVAWFAWPKPAPASTGLLWVAPNASHGSASMGLGGAF